MDAKKVARCPREGKIIYHSAAHAGHGLSHFRHKSDRDGRRRAPMEAYSCSYCHGWHVGNSHSYSPWC